MRNTILTLIFTLGTASAFAHGDHLPPVDTHPGRWFCTADGYVGGHMQQVEGPLASTESEARRAAVLRCVELSVSACGVRSCINEQPENEVAGPLGSDPRVAK